MNSRVFFLSALALITSSSYFADQLPEAPKADESWSTPSLKGSNLKPYPPLLGVNDNQPLFHRELLRVGWRNSDPIDLYVIVPRTDGAKSDAAKAPADPTVAKPAAVNGKTDSTNAKTVGTNTKVAPKPPVIIYLYNYNTTPYRYTLNNVCIHLTTGGVAAVGFPTALSPTRFFFRGATKWFVSELPEALATSAHDVQMVINYLETRQDIDTSRIGIFGEGSGAAVAILAASADPRIKAMDLEDAWGDWPEFLAKAAIIPENERSTYLKPEFLKNVAGLDPVDYLPKLTIPVRIQYSTSPKAPVPPEVQKKMDAALPPSAAHTPIETN
jgi:hypothetical protein